MARTYKNTIACDLDGVVVDFEGSFCDIFGHDNREMSNLFKRYPKVDKVIIEELVNDPEAYRTLLPMFGGIDFLVMARKLGFYILLLTSRPKHLAEVTRDTLEGYDIPYNEIWYAQNKALAIEEYNKMYPSRKISLLVDDMPENLTKLPEGVVGMAWEQPWNKNHYPRAKYDQESMKLVMKADIVSDWTEIWKVEDKDE